MPLVPIELQTELQKEANFLKHLICIGTDTPLYFTDLDVDVWFEDTQYIAWGLSVQEISYSLTATVDRLDIQLDDVDSTFTALALNEEIRGKRLTVHKVALDSHAQVIGAAKFFSGIIDEFSGDDKNGVMRMQVYSPLILWKRRTPRRIHQATCPWEYGDSETCRYVGTMGRCDQSYAACSERANTLNFGGFRFLPSLQNKQIWWGRTPK